METAMSTLEIPLDRFQPLRTWIPLLLVPLMMVARYVPTWFPETPMVWMVGAFVPGLLSILIMFWWFTYSRATWGERILGILGLNGILALSVWLVDPTMQGPPFIVLTLPTVTAGFAIALIFLAGQSPVRRTATAVVVALLASVLSLSLKNDGATGDFSFGFDWRWKATPEEIFLAQRAADPTLDRPSKIEPSPSVFQNPPWPGFRGPDRNGIVQDADGEVMFADDWEQELPEELWRITLGPAWSSFAVADGFLVTQEQRGEYEAVVCYDAETGGEVWAQEIKSRFFDPLGGLGPRATPTIAEGSIFAQGAEGVLVKLDPTNGTVQWQVDLRELAGREPPMWGYSGSPLVTQGLVLVHAAGDGNQGIIAFDSQRGDIKWSVPADQGSYASLHLTRFFNQEQVVLLSDGGAVFLDPLTGAELTKHDFKIPGYRALQPGLVTEPGLVTATRLLIPGEYAGTRLIELQKEEGQWTTQEIWTSRYIKPDFNDMVIHQGFAYGFDGSIFTCIDLNDGSRRWKKGRYGKGQAILLADSNQILVVSEQGELILLAANPDQHQELGKIVGVSGKTWNHPVVVKDRLYLRNANQAVCYRLPLRRNPAQTEGPSNEGPSNQGPPNEGLLITGSLANFN